MMIRIALTVFCLFSVCPAHVGQTVFGGNLPSPSPQDTTSRRTEHTPSDIFRAIERGISTGDVSLFSDYFGNTLRLDIRGSQTGYYSANQAGQILRHFIGRRATQKFRFSREEEGEIPYATGGGVFTSGGRSERIQIYVGVVKADSRWVISQFNIY